ncbi:MAG: hypothetical protein U9N77_00480 [Thermodesulfobacteriota bacterium]|nr:hypothetical protein [Thermodesulfobacteriota bacterium]
MDYQKLMKKARATNDRRDKEERDFGYAPPTDGTVDIQIRTAMCAIFSGIGCNDWDNIAEAQVLLDNAHKALTGRGYKLEERI